LFFVQGKTPKDAAWKTEFFLHTCLLFLKNEEQTSKKKLQSNVSWVKQSPHAKIQLFFNTFKTPKKSQGTFLPAGFQL